MKLAAQISDGVMVTYRSPVESVRALVPRGLDLATRDGFAFWNIVACRVRIAGLSHVQVAYRIHVRADGADGLWFVRTEVDGALAAAIRRAAFDFRPHVSAIRLARRLGIFTLEVTGPAPARFYADLTLPEPYPRPSLAPPFRPTGLSLNGRGVRRFEAEFDSSRWRETPITVLDARWGLFERLGQRRARLERAVRFDPIVFRWRVAEVAPRRRAV